MIYFDNAATSFPKPDSVIYAVNDCITRYCGNPGRGAHRLSSASSEKIYEAREEVARLLNSELPENVTFTLNATYALNTAIKTIVKNGDHVLISDVEHNAVLRPLEKLRRDGIIEYSIFKTGVGLEEEISKKLTSKSSCIIANAVSNVTGAETPLKALSKIREKYHVSLIIDASQLIGHKRIDLRETPCDVLCAPSHKALFGLQGAGFCVFSNNVPSSTLIEGGSGNDSASKEMPKMLPEHFEAGTLPTPTIVSLLEGIKFIKSVGLEQIEEKLSELTKFSVEILTSFKGITVYGGNLGVVSFCFSSVPPYVVANELDEAGICARSGLHCSPLAHKKAGTPSGGATRLSFSYFNTKSELDALYKVLLNIKRKYE